MARITILTVGSRGDVQPFCAIALGLIEKGHGVTLASSPNFSSFVAALDIPFAPVAGDFKQLLSSPQGMQLLEGDSDVQLIDDELLWQMMTDAWEACQGSDLIVFSPLATWGYHLAESLKIPAILATSIPAAATREFPFLGFAERSNKKLRGLLNLLSYRLVGLLFWRRTANVINRFRQEILGLPRLPFLGAQYRRDKPPFLSPLPIVDCYSAAVVPPPSDWEVSTHQAGYCFLEETAAFTPSAELQAFLNEEPRPFYVGFGSMISRHPEQLMQTIVAALKKAGVRAVLCSGWGCVHRENLPSFIHLLEEVPHDWLFPKVVAAVHHGGAGTTAATLKAGIPSIVVPFFADQPVWGAVLEGLGVSAATIPKNELTSDRLADGVCRLIEDDSFQVKAQQLQAQIQSEDGVARTVETIESYLR